MPYDNMLAHTPRGAIGHFAEQLILAGFNNSDVLTIVRKRFPTARTSDASIRWYRCKVRNKNAFVPASREVQKADF
ncbi:hypothetical protein GQ651_08500 [Alphaproteobacteria bacterium GH1-50]|uniref:Uncharacterized protein n=1 Tax=Kangsaoukella pontilimi TaxID=2691042 RepID=A0A7C9IFX2_9RHOB|nr:hypothetical protein [Kangsaoukella pontilimi]MXQ07884.1 hypothetical protein [Kangsaoukella pontilimi]